MLCLSFETNRDEFKKLIADSQKEHPVFSVLKLFSEAELLETLSDNKGDQDFAIYRTNHFKALVKTNKDLETTTENGDTLLMFATYLGCMELVVDILKENKNCLNMQNKGGYTALMLASERGHYRVSKYLISENADVNLHSIKNETAGTIIEKRYYVDEAEDKDNYYSTNLFLKLIDAGLTEFTCNTNILLDAFVHGNKKSIANILNKYPQLLLDTTSLNMSPYKYYVTDGVMDQENQYFIENNEKNSYIESLYMDKLNKGEMTQEQISEYWKYNKQYYDYLYEAQKHACDVQSEKVKNVYLCLNAIKENHDHTAYQNKDQEDEDENEDLENEEFNHSKKHFYYYDFAGNSRNLFVKAMQQNTTITHLELNYAECVTDVCEILKFNHTITNIVFMSEDKETSLSDIKKLVNILEFSFVTSITFDKAISEESLLHLLSYKKLIHFQSNLNNHINWTGEHSKLLLEHTKLESLIISIYSGMDVLCNTVSIHPSLKIFKLTIEYCDIPYKDISFLHEIIQKNKKLEAFYLNFGIADIKEFTQNDPYHVLEYKKLCEALKMNENLHAFRINCHSNEISNWMKADELCKAEYEILLNFKKIFDNNESLDEEIGQYMLTNLELGFEENSIHYDKNGFKNSLMCHCKDIFKKINYYCRLNEKFSQLSNAITKMKLEFGNQMNEKEQTDTLNERLENLRYNTWNYNYWEESSLGSQHTVRLKNAITILAKILIRKFPENREFAYYVLEKVPNDKINARFEAQTMLANLKLKKQTNSLSLDSQQNSNELVSLPHYFDAMNCLKLGPIISDVVLNQGNANQDYSLALKQMYDKYLKMQEKNKMQCDDLSSKVDSLVNNYLNQNENEVLVHVQPNSETIVKLLKMIKKSSEEIDQLQKQISKVNDKNNNDNNSGSCNQNHDPLTFQNKKRKHEEEKDKSKLDKDESMSEKDNEQTSTKKIRVSKNNNNMKI